jgi:hypothetical protein
MNLDFDFCMAHSEEAITAINKAVNSLDFGTLHTYRDILELILTEWADDADLIDISKFLKERLDT